MRADPKRGDPTQHGARFSVAAQLAVSDAAEAANTAGNARPEILRNGLE